MQARDKERAQPIDILSHGSYPTRRRKDYLQKKKKKARKVIRQTTF